MVLPDCPPPIFALAHSMGGAVVIRACHDGSRWFERIVLSAPMIALPSGRLTQVAGPLARLMRLLGFGGAYVPTGDSAAHRHRNFIGNMLTSDPVRYARNAAVLEQEPALGLGAPTVAWADVALRQMKLFADPAYAADIRQPILMVAAGRDEVCFNAGHRDVRTESACGPASHSCWRQARDSAGTGSLPRAVLGGIRRLRAGHAAVLVRKNLQRRSMHAPVAGNDDPPAPCAGPFSQVVTMPPAPAMIGMIATISCGLISVSMIRSICPAASMQ